MAPIGALSGFILWSSIVESVDHNTIQRSRWVPIVGIGIYISFFISISALLLSGRLDETVDTKYATKIAQYLDKFTKQGSLVYIIDEDGGCLNGPKLMYYTSGKYNIIGNNCVYGLKTEPQILIENLRLKKIDYLVVFSHGSVWNEFFEEFINIPCIIGYSDRGELKSITIN